MEVAGGIGAQIAATSDKFRGREVNDEGTNERSIGSGGAGGGG